METRKERSKTSGLFLFPRRVIREGHLSKHDVKAIKYNLLKTFNSVYAIASFVMFRVTGFIFIFNYNRVDNFVEYYGVTGLIGNIFCTFGSLSSFLLAIAGFLVKKENISRILQRISGIVFYIACAVYMIFGIQADASAGFTTQTDSISASLILITILCLLQMPFWIDALILDVLVTAAIFAVSIVCRQVYGMHCLYYYLLTGVMYPAVCYLIVTILFYAEAQHYKEMLLRERMTNRAVYDTLTQCKTRYALKHYVYNAANRFDGKEDVNLLVALFDIDDFKMYNDQFSHLVGDYCLKSVCEAVRSQFPSPNLEFFRYGGEEFLLFFELRDPDDALMILQQIKNSVSQLKIEAPKGSPKDVVTISVGGILLKDILTFDIEKILRSVDSALYQAKASGKDCICFQGEIFK